MSTPNQVAADLAGMIAAARIAAHKTVVTFGARLQASVKRNASGRPGPNAPTGDYRRSINRRTTMRATVSIAVSRAAPAWLAAATAPRRFGELNVGLMIWRPPAPGAPSRA